MVAEYIRVFLSTLSGYCVSNSKRYDCFYYILSTSWGVFTNNASITCYRPTIWVTGSIVK